MVSEARSKGWEKRREKYGPSGRPPGSKNPGRYGPREKLSDRNDDAEYLARMNARCIVTEKGCWEWQGYRHKPPRNYGDMGYRGENWATHRLAYHLNKGPIPKGMVVMHSCDNPPCCNPDHLSLGTHLQNMADCRAKGRYYYANLTHCKRGHEFNEENTYIIKTPGIRFGLRACKICMRERGRLTSKERSRRYREKRQAKITGSTVS